MGGVWAGNISVAGEVSTLPACCSGSSVVQRDCIIVVGFESCKGALGQVSGDPSERRFKFTSYK